MHGGTISSGRRYTRAVLGAYWISSISGFLNTTLPGVTARLRPTANAPASLLEMWPRCASAARLTKPLHQARAFGRERAFEHDGVGRDEVGRRERVDELLRRENEPLLLGLRERRRCRELVQIFAGEQIALLHQGEEGVLVPLRCREPAVARRGFRDHGDRVRARRVARERVGCRAPQRRPSLPEFIVERGQRRDLREARRGRRRRGRRTLDCVVLRHGAVRAGPPSGPVAGSRLPALGELRRRMRLARRRRCHHAKLQGGQERRDERGGSAIALHYTRDTVRLVSARAIPPWPSGRNCARADTRRSARHRYTCSDRRRGRSRCRRDRVAGARARTDRRAICRGGPQRRARRRPDRCRRTRRRHRRRLRTLRGRSRVRATRSDCPDRHRCEGVRRSSLRSRPRQARASRRGRCRRRFPARSVTSTGRQSAVRIEQTTRVSRVTAASAVGELAVAPCRVATAAPWTCASGTGEAGKNRSKRRRFSSSAAGSSRPPRARFIVAYAPALTPPARVVVSAQTFSGAGQSGTIQSSRASRSSAASAAAVAALIGLRPARAARPAETRSPAATAIPSGMRRRSPDARAQGAPRAAPGG